MSETITSEINDAQEKLALWESRINDPDALSDLNKTREECIALANYFEGVAEGLIRARDLIEE